MEYTDYTINLSKNSPRYYKHGAVLINGNDIVAVGYNDYRRHAEINAILKYERRVLPKGTRPEPI